MGWRFDWGTFFTHSLTGLGTPSQILGFKKTGSGTQGSEQPHVGALRIQQSSYGVPIAIVFGQTRIAPNLIWYGDFTPIAHQSSQQSGGKGGGTSHQSSTSYT